MELQIDSESEGRDQGLQINLVPRAPEQLPYIVKRASLTRLPIWRNSRLKSRQNHRTIASDSDLTSICASLSSRRLAHHIYSFRDHSEMNSLRIIS